ncbi:nuclear transport factor 2 family protein [Halocatena pleomorpha]|uniref:Nuclear transport factor 2 family protein n=1 Tax=Halocatena pleomorpha TaxID=1785090 RepID=A0A3P3R9V5_9EURY|nr:nuclear transport factor 2 family protein [Halocatena pleomorpha]RRJ29243.1 nuclear transport factor 2 family protein [Halocatena pleomorpha]
MDALARAYYRAIDEGEYEALSALLAPEFTHDRPDRTIDGREAFVQFMREQRPETDTTHEITDVFRNEHAIAVRGKLIHADGEEWFEFVDVFSVEGDAIVSLKTYSR